MAEVRFYKVNSLPSVTKSNSWYLVRTITGFEIWVTDDNGTPIQAAGGGGTGSDTYTGIAGQNLGGGKLVYLQGGLFFLYDASDPLLADTAFGITKAAALSGASVDVQISGIYTEVGLGLTTDVEYYAGLTGLLTTSPTNVVITSIGIAVTPDKIKIEIQPSIITV